MILEALIAILIFSIGILAMVGLQTSAVNTVADSKYRSTAGFLADQMVGTVWAYRQIDPTAAASLVTAYIPDHGFCTPVACPAANTVTTANAGTLAAAWVASGVSQLPNGTGSITIVGPRVNVTVGWQPPNDATAHRHVVSAYIN